MLDLLDVAKQAIKGVGVNWDVSKMERGIKNLSDDKATMFEMDHAAWPLGVESGRPGTNQASPASTQVDASKYSIPGSHLMMQNTPRIPIPSEAPPTVSKKCDARSVLPHHTGPGMPLRPNGRLPRRPGARHIWATITHSRT